MRKRDRRGRVLLRIATERCERDFLTLALRVNNSNEIRVRRATKVYGETYTFRSRTLVWVESLQIRAFKGRSPVVKKESRSHGSGHLPIFCFLMSL